MKFLLILFGLVFVKIYSWDQGEYLVYLDPSIVEVMKNPHNETPSLIIDYIKLYNNNFTDLIEKIENKTKGIDTEARILLETDGPRFANFPTTSEELKNTYLWDPKDIEELNKLLDETRQLWKKFKKNTKAIQAEMANATTTPVPDYN